MVSHTNSFISDWGLESGVYSFAFVLVSRYRAGVLIFLCASARKGVCFSPSRSAAYKKAIFCLFVRA